MVATTKNIGEYTDELILPNVKATKALIMSLTEVYPTSVVTNFVLMSYEDTHTNIMRPGIL